MDIGDGAVRPAVPIDLPSHDWLDAKNNK